MVGQWIVLVVSNLILEMAYDGLGRERSRELLVYSESLISEHYSNEKGCDFLIEPIRNLINSISRFDLELLLDFVRERLKIISNTAYYDAFISCLSTIQLGLFPADILEHSLNLVEILADYYCEAHGFALRAAFADCLAKVLEPLVEPVTAEVNLPKWKKVFSKILLKQIFYLCEKPKYRAATIYLASIVLCLCTREIFTEKWLGLCEAISIFIRVYLSSLSSSFTNILCILL